MDIALVDTHHSYIRAAVVAAAGELPQLTFIGGFPTVAELLAGSPCPGIVVLGLNVNDEILPQDNVSRLRRAGAVVIALIGDEDPYRRRALRDCDLIGVVSKAEPVTALTLALQRAASTDSREDARAPRPPAPDERWPRAGLSPRETEVLAHYALGHTAAWIAHTLSISEGTVSDHVKHIRRKYREAGRPAHDKVALYQRAVQDGVLPCPAQSPELGR
ncbi:LuxR C-terminal-related transcriptional regulator [Brevibacterium sp. 50QC2O2]|uniref:helix-turn-helix transcriptional regulator n=1 Tax=Brevibacterium sp. 50QC2O2 TaxID=2968459 RepID=UPI00211BFE55|nr:LuxR C-terminal-related transcriptional regulator [Brevibacterium sp. 50QC2O2]MCQ9387644.1 LuxR C-terminal-related transcriptional regulator [Brevibacterium sp. 50QC2O2]